MIPHITQYDKDLAELKKAEPLTDNVTRFEQKLMVLAYLAGKYEGKKEVTDDEQTKT